jgi:hypothetical protein
MQPSFLTRISSPDKIVLASRALRAPALRDCCRPALSSEPTRSLAAHRTRGPVGITRCAQPVVPGTFLRWDRRSVTSRIGGRLDLATLMEDGRRSTPLLGAPLPRLCSRAGSIVIRLRLQAPNVWLRSCPRLLAWRAVAAVIGTRRRPAPMRDRDRIRFKNFDLERMTRGNIVRVGRAAIAARAS